MYKHILIKPTNVSPIALDKGSVYYYKEAETWKICFFDIEQKYRSLTFSDLQYKAFSSSDHISSGDMNREIITENFEKAIPIDYKALKEGHCFEIDESVLPRGLVDAFYLCSSIFANQLNSLLTDLKGDSFFYRDESKSAAGLSLTFSKMDTMIDLMALMVGCVFAFPFICAYRVARYAYDKASSLLGEKKPAISIAEKQVTISDPDSSLTAVFMKTAVALSAVTLAAAVFYCVTPALFLSIATVSSIGLIVSVLAWFAARIVTGLTGYLMDSVSSKMNPDQNDKDRYSCLSNFFSRSADGIDQALGYLGVRPECT